ncbi:MAG: hypothetical protein L3J24_03555 [Xanthomonadales bacterium]|nr:hypothetical protein [Xanthomonadales bacterium]
MGGGVMAKGTEQLYDEFSKNSWADLLLVCLLAGIGALAFNTLPLISSLWAENYAYSTEDIGRINGEQFAGFTFCIFASLFWLEKLPLRSVVIVGLLGSSTIAFVPYLSSPKDWSLLFVGIGMANGLILAPSLALLGRSVRVERAYGLMYAMQMLLAIGITLALAISPLKAWGLGGALSLLGVFSFVGISLTFALPNTVLPKVHRSNVPLDWLTTIPIIVGLLFFMVGMVGIWSFLGNLEVLKLEALKATPGTRPSFLISATLLAALFGSFSAAWLDDRMGVWMPLFVGLILILSGIVCMAISVSILMFFVDTLLASFGWNFTLAYITAELSYADKSGKLVALSPGIIGFGGAIGTVGLGVVLASQGTALVYALASIAIIIGFVLLLSAVHLSHTGIFFDAFKRIFQ